jgi:succinate dehydrogenase / fumarate reductase membrane anchor subunit
MNYRTPLGRARGLGAAGEGSRHWWWQRVSALALIPLLVWLMMAVTHLPSASHAEVVGWVKAPWNTLLLIAFVGAAFFHAMLGVQVIIEDYVHHVWLKTAGILGIKLLCVSLTLAAVLATLRIAYRY